LTCPRPRRLHQHGQCPDQWVGDLPAVGAPIRLASVAGARTRTPVPQTEPRGRVLAPAVSRRRRAKVSMSIGYGSGRPMTWWKSSVWGSPGRAWPVRSNYAHAQTPSPRSLRRRPI